MNVLAIDTATAACSAALWRGGEVRARRHRLMERGHAEALMPMVAEVMAEARLDYTAIDLVATTVGPGTFTGIRVGLAAARGLALACGVPAVGVTTLEALAHGLDCGLDRGLDRHAAGDGAVVAALDARRGEIYVQAFESGGDAGGDSGFHAGLNALGAPAALTAAEAAAALPPGPLVLVGNGAAALAGALAAAGVAHRIADGPSLPDAAVVAALAARRFTAAPPPEEPPRPLYIRGHGARLPKDAKAQGS
jgi:tRNA threonylcarbamoyladenosine biosynthesis protein TsaB